MKFFEIGDGYSTIKLNPDLFSLDVAYSAAYTLLDKAFITFDGDPDSEILVKLSFKDDSENTVDKLEELSKDYHNNLITENGNRLGSNKKEYLRVLLLKKSFKEINLESLDESVNLPKSADNDDNSSEAGGQDDLFTDEDFDDDLDEDFEFDDPEGIAVPWDEKFSDDDADSDDKVDLDERKIESDGSLGSSEIEDNLD